MTMHMHPFFNIFQCEAVLRIIISVSYYIDLNGFSVRRIKYENMLILTCLLCITSKGIYNVTMQ